MLSPQQVAEKWRSNTSNAQQAFKDGVNGVTISPMEKAAAAQDRFLSGIQQAVSSGRWAAGLRSRTLEQWKASMTGKGAARIAGGVADAVPKMVAFMTTWLPLQQQLRDRVAAMPKGSVADSINRAAFAISFNAAFSKRLPGS